MTPAAPPRYRIVLVLRNGRRKPMKAVDIENTINAKDTDFGRFGLRLHPSRVPLVQAVGDQIELLPADDMDNCESGYCHT